MKTMLKGETRMVRIGDTLHVNVGMETFAKLNITIEEAMNRGMAADENGVKRWYDTVTVYDSTKTGSAAYTWKGDKVKAEKFLMTKKADGTVERKSVGFVWKEW